MMGLSSDTITGANALLPVTIVRPYFSRAALMAAKTITRGTAMRDHSALVLSGCAL